MFTGAPVPHSFYYKEEEEQKDSGYKGTCIDVDGNKYSCIIVGDDKDKPEVMDISGTALAIFFILGVMLVTYFWGNKIYKWMWKGN